LQTISTKKRSLERKKETKKRTNQNRSNEQVNCYLLMLKHVRSGSVMGEINSVQLLQLMMMLELVCGSTLETLTTT